MLNLNTYIQNNETRLLNFTLPTTQLQMNHGPQHTHDTLSLLEKKAVNSPVGTENDFLYKTPIGHALRSITDRWAIAFIL